MKILAILLGCVLTLTACASKNKVPAAKSNQVAKPTPGVGEANARPHYADAESNLDAPSQGDRPRTVRDFFMLLPDKYFTLEGCEPAKDKDCRKAKLDYLKTFAQVEDTANGYLKGGCDGGQACFEMALFKRPDGTFLVGLATAAEMMNEHYFLDYQNGSWTDISAQVVPEFSKKYMYELPRYGTTVKVYAKKIVEKGDDYEISDRGQHLFDLVWKDGRFTRK